MDRDDETIRDHLETFMTINDKLTPRLYYTVYS